MCSTRLSYFNLNFSKTLVSRNNYVPIIIRLFIFPQQGKPLHNRQGKSVKVSPHLSASHRPNKAFCKHNIGVTSY